MRHHFLFIIFLYSISLSSQNGLYLGGQLGYGLNTGPIEKYTGVQMGGFFRYQFNKFFLQSSYDHITGTPNYGTTYSKDLPNVPVYDIYDQNYGLAIYPTDDFSEVKVGVHQFDPSFGKYVARQVSLGVGYAFPIKVNTIMFKILPTLSFTLRHINENFVYGVKQIRIEDTFQSNNFVEVNHLIFAYLRYTNIGYIFVLPIEVSITNSASMSAAISYGNTFKGYSQFNFSLGIVSKI